MMGNEPTSSFHATGQAQLPAGSFSLRPHGACPCGREPLDGLKGFHVVGPRCREKVERHVRRRFGPHRYGGRHAAEVPDVIQDCYQKLLGPGGLDSFRPDPAADRSDAFSAWLWKVVSNHCNNKLKSLAALPAVSKERPVDKEEPDGFAVQGDAITPEQEFSRRVIHVLSEAAVAAVAPTWRSRGPMWSERFDVIIGLIFEQEADTERAGKQLGIDDGHLRVLKHKLLGVLRQELRQQVRDGLALEPGLEPEVSELMIDREIEALFQAAYPGSDPPVLLTEDAEPEAAEKGDHERHQPRLGLA